MNDLRKSKILIAFLFIFVFANLEFAEGQWKKTGEKCVANCEEGVSSNLPEKVPNKVPNEEKIPKSQVITFTAFDREIKPARQVVMGAVSPGGAVSGIIKQVEPAEVAKCASIVFRNNWGGGRAVREWDFIAFFGDGKKVTGNKIEAERYHIEEGQTSTANVCFGTSNYPIVGMDCNF